MRTAARDASTREAAALRSGLRSTASPTSAVSSRSWKVRIQFGTTAPLRCGPAQLPGICARADSGMMSAPKGGCLSAQLARVRHTADPRKTRIFMWAQASVELPNEPIQFGRDPDKNFTDNVDHLAVLGINRAFAASASSEERVAIPGREKQSHGDTLFRRRYRLCVWQVSTNRHLALGRGPQDRVHFALDNTTRVRRHEDFRFIPRL